MCGPIPPFSEVTASKKRKHSADMVLPDAWEGMTDKNLRQPPPSPVMDQEASVTGGAADRDITDLVAPAAAGTDVELALEAPSLNSVKMPREGSSRRTKRAPSASSASISSLNEHLSSTKSKRAWPDGLVVQSAGKLRRRKDDAAAE